MNCTRRHFLKLAAAAPAAAGLSGINPLLAADASPRRFGDAQKVHSICAFCGVGCGVIFRIREGALVGVEGDPEHPINEGALCSKGQAHYNMAFDYEQAGRPLPNRQRLTQVLYRAPGANQYEEKGWDWALDTIASRIKATRDRTFEATAQAGAQQVTVNRTPAIAWLGSACCTGEENYLFHKLTRALGLIHIDHCARL